MAVSFEEQEKCWKSISDWAEKEEAKIRLRYNGQQEIIEHEIYALHKSKLQVNGLWWRGMGKPGKPYRLPIEIELEIVRFMRESDLVEPPFEQGDLHVLLRRLEMTKLYSPQTNEDFVQFCQMKIFSFVLEKGVSFKQDRVLKREGPNIIWSSFTAAWLEPGWNGDTGFPGKSSSSLTAPSAASPGSLGRQTAATPTSSNNPLSPLSFVSLQSCSSPAPSVDPTPSQQAADRFPRSAKHLHQCYEEYNSDLDRNRNNFNDGSPRKRKRSASPKEAALFSIAASYQSQTKEEDDLTKSPTSYRKVVWFDMRGTGENIHDGPPQQPPAVSPLAPKQRHQEKEAAVPQGARSQPASSVTKASLFASTLTSQMNPSPAKRKRASILAAPNPAAPPTTSIPSVACSSAAVLPTVALSIEARPDSGGNSRMRLMTPNTFYRDPSGKICMEAPRALRSKGPESPARLLMLDWSERQWPDNHPQLRKQRKEGGFRKEESTDDEDIFECLNPRISSAINRISCRQILDLAMTQRPPSSFPDMAPPLPAANTFQITQNLVALGEDNQRQQSRAQSMPVMPRAPLKMPTRSPLGLNVETPDLQELAQDMEEQCQRMSSGENDTAHEAEARPSKQATEMDEMSPGCHAGFSDESESDQEDQVKLFTESLASYLQHLKPSARENGRSHSAERVVRDLEERSPSVEYLEIGVPCDDEEPVQGFDESDSAKDPFSTARTACASALLSSGGRSIQLSSSVAPRSATSISIHSSTASPSPEPVVISVSSNPRPILPPPTRVVRNSNTSCAVVQLNSSSIGPAIAAGARIRTENGDSRNNKEFIPDTNEGQADQDSADNLDAKIFNLKLVILDRKSRSLKIHDLATHKMYETKTLESEKHLVHLEEQVRKKRKKEEDERRMEEQMKEEKKQRRKEKKMKKRMERAAQA